MPGPDRAFAKRALLISAAVLLVVGVVFYTGFYFGYHERGRIGSLEIFAGDPAPPSDIDFTPLWRAWSIIQEKYVPATTSDPLTDEAMLWGAIEGLAESTGDPYTVFFPPVESALFEQDISGNFEGVGMEVGMQGGILAVIAPLKGTPAERAGIRAGDLIVKIDGESTDGITVDEAVQKIRGKAGTTVTFTIAREGESEFKEIEVTRGVIQIPTIETSYRSDGIFVIELYNFAATAPAQFRAALREFVQSGSKKLILDLRGNPGGYLEAAVDAASWFLPPGKPVVVEDYGEGKEERIHRTRGTNLFGPDLKMVILVDKGSASASEILAGALKEHGIATLVGENTFGKGSVQELVHITSDTSLKVTIARWLTPNGVSISEGGLTPDIEVKPTPEDIAAGRDPQFEKAVEILKQ